MMRKREKELEELLKDKDTELEKARRETEKIKADALEIKRRFEERDALVQKLQARESDVVAAFAEIQSARARKMKETEDEVRQMKDNAGQILDKARFDADRIKEDAIKEADEIKTKAQSEAETIVSQARSEADEIKDKMDELREGCENENKKMKLHLSSIAKQCKEHIAALEERILMLSDNDPEKETGEDEEPLDEAQIEGEKYDTAQEDSVGTDGSEKDAGMKPADVMKSIYEIEKRELPNSEERDAAPSEGEPDHVWTVDEIVDSVMDEGTSSEDDYLEKLIGEILQ